VLVVDDNTDAADTMAAMVVALGGEPATAYSETEGVQRTSGFSTELRAGIIRH
jgi:hypothetical protein